QWLRYSEVFMSRYPLDVTNYLLMHHGLYSRDEINLMPLASADIEARLRQMHKPDIFDNARVILMADQGHRFAKLRVYATRSAGGEIAILRGLSAGRVPRKRERLQGVREFEEQRYPLDVAVRYPCHAGGRYSLAHRGRAFDS
ncbi:hypothetical protein AAVH_38485, partial [Aphelenchoides avenae]